MSQPLDTFDARIMVSVLAAASLIACGEDASTVASGGQGGTAPTSAGASTGGSTAQAGSPSTSTAGVGGGTTSQAGSSSGGGGSAGTTEMGGSAGVAGASGASGGLGATGGIAGAGGGAGGSTADPTYVPDPSWTCGAPEGLNAPMRGKLMFSATLELGETHDVGQTPYGERRVLDIKGGSVTGDRLQATVLTGGLDLELTLSNGAVELEQLNVLKAADGTLIYLRSCGMAPSAAPLVRFVPDFEAPSNSSLAWLNTSKLVGTRSIDEAGKKMQLAFYDVSVAADGPKLQLQDPAGVPHQPWECSTATGQKGASVFTETVGIGGSLAVGASKRGTRNIIPITGGNVSGRVTGKVLPGGADFQLVGAKTVLDARYTLEADDGEVIMIRNCGAFGAMVPLFEARADGPYAFLNANTFVSSDPGSAAGGVSITIYERK